MSRNTTPSAFDPGWWASGLILGLLVGGIVALFTAPISGKPLRTKIKQRFSFLDRDLRERAEHLMLPDRVGQSLLDGQAAARKRLENGALAK